MAELVFDLKQVSYAYLGKILGLQAVDLCIPAGAKVGIIGANGTGKSTLLMLLDGLIFPDAGSIRVFGEELREACFEDEKFSCAFRKQIGFVFQNPDIQLFCPTVRDDIIFGPLHLGLPGAEIKQRLETVASDLKLEHLLDRSPQQLSAGEKKKVAIASVLAIQPQVLILDEPTAGLDPRTTREIVDRLLAEHAAGKTIITATQDLHIAEELSDVLHVFGAEHGIVRSAPAAQILSDEPFLHEYNLAHIHPHQHPGRAHTHAHRHGV